MDRLPFQEKKIKLDVKESFLVFKIIVFFFKFQYSHKRFPAVRVLPLKHEIISVLLYTKTSCATL